MGQRLGAVAHAALARRLCAALVVVVAATAGCGPRSAVPRVAAASDLQFALADVAARFATDTGEQVDLVFGSSGTLARQIEDGAPFDLFLSADEAFVSRLQTAGRARDAGTLYAVGRIVLFAPAGSPLVPDDGLAGLARLVARGAVPRFAIANPAHAPYGRAAQQALQTHGLWDPLQPALVFGENVSQAAQFAMTGHAVGGIIAYSLARAPALRGKGTHALIPADAHDPLRQRMVLLAKAGPAAERFYAYLQTADARHILTQYGFVRPD